MSASTYSTVASAIEFLSAQRKAQPSLEEVAAHVGLSPFHFQRLFQRWAGVTPKEYLQALTLADAKKHLQNASPVLDTALDVGLSGSSRLHDLFLKVEKMTPGEYKSGAQGLTIHWTVADTPFGEALFAGTERGLVRLSFLDSSPREDNDNHREPRTHHDECSPQSELAEAWPGATLERSPQVLAPWVEEAQRRIAGDKPRISLSLLLRGSELRLKVWEALLAIPSGKCASYSKVAAGIGTPRAIRAVASAIGENPIAFLIPCHRVLRESGELGGYRWGLTRKRALLASEQVRSTSRAAAHALGSQPA